MANTQFESTLSPKRRAFRRRLGVPKNQQAIRTIALVGEDEGTAQPTGTRLSAYRMPSMSAAISRKLQPTRVGAGQMSSGMTTGGAFGSPLMVGSNMAVPPEKPKQQMLPAGERYARAKQWAAREFAGEPPYVKGPDISVVPATSGELIGGESPQDNRKALIRIDWRGVEPKTGHRAQMEASRLSALRRLRENPKFVEHEARQKEARSAEARAAALTKMREQRAKRDAARQASLRERWMLGMAARNPSIAALMRERLQSGGQVAAAQEQANVRERIERMRQEGEAARQKDLLEFYREQGVADPEKKVALQSAAMDIYNKAIQNGATPFQANMAAQKFYPEFIAPASPEDLAREDLVRPRTSLWERFIHGFSMRPYRNIRRTPGGVGNWAPVTSR